MSLVKKLSILLLGAILSLPAAPLLAQDREPGTDFSLGTSATLPILRNWMNSEVRTAWAAGYRGQYSNIILVDDFRSATRHSGNLGLGTRNLRHGEWTRLTADMIAPTAGLVSIDFGTQRAVALRSRVTNVINLSYGMEAAPGASGALWGLRENSIVTYATQGTAVVVKAAGNSAVAIGSTNAAGKLDYLNTALTGTNAIFVGSLSTHGSVEAPATLASYSNYAGSNASVQARFLTVGVRGDLTALYGTSFAAPTVSGYAALLGSKFRAATPSQIANQLLNTARTDTISGYNVAIHGKGEASIARAIAPLAIN